MRFETTLRVDRRAVLAALGYGEAAPDAAGAGLLEQAAGIVEAAATPRWVYRECALEQPPRLPQAALVLPGRHIARHLAGCDRCVVLALTLGGQVEQQLCAATATRIPMAVVLDAAASVLVEQYADAAEALLRAGVEREGRYLTGRFSPGYGDLPITLQDALLRLLNAQRAIGLTVTGSGILVPRKSITALLGSAAHPVQGQLAACDDCTLAGRCERQGEGRYCGKSVVRQ